jgi:surfactin synthase thioesterase subunit
MEITHQLEQQGRAVVALIAGASFPFSALTRYLPFEDRWQFTSDARLAQLIASWGGPSEPINNELRQHLLRNFRRDSRLAFRYQKRRSRWRLKAPVVNIVSRDDRLTRGFLKRHRLWAEVSGDVQLRVLEQGGHYFVSSQAAAVADIIRELTTSHSDAAEVPAVRVEPRGGLIAIGAYQRSTVSSTAETLPG